MKNTERHTADMQITGANDSKISVLLGFYKLQSCLLFATYRHYEVNNYNEVIGYDIQLTRRQFLSHGQAFGISKDC